MADKSKNVKMRTAESNTTQESKAEELTEAQYEQLTKDVEEFQHSYLSYLANTSNFDLVATISEDGRHMSKDYFNALKRESIRLGVQILYTYEVGNNVVIINPNNMKTCILSNGEVH